VSLVTPVFNNEKYIIMSITNILGQTYQNIEHIFIDGGSTDKTKSILEHYHNLYPDKVKFISEPDKGIGDAVNKGWKLGKGDIIGWIDADDNYVPDAVESVVDIFSHKPCVSVVYGGGRLINEDGTFLRNYITKDFNWKETRDNLNQMHTPPSAFYRATILKYMPTLPDSGDNLELHLSVGKNFNIHHLDKMIFNVRLRKESISQSHNPKSRAVLRGCYRTSYEVCRKYGGSIFAPRCRRYFIFQFLEWTHLYDFVVYGVLVKIRKFAFVNKVLSKLGMVTN
jgi:glycosyltransferase involved in cell wall biosynthesis